MFNFGSFINLTKNLLLILAIGLVIYGVSLLIKLILNKTGNSKVWENIIGKYWTIAVFVISSIVYIIIASCRHLESSFVNGIMNGLLLTGIQASMFKIVNLIVNLFNKSTSK